MEKIHGEEGSRLAAESHAAAIDRIEAIGVEEGIGCDFRRVDGYLFLAPDDPPRLLEEEKERPIERGFGRGVRAAGTASL